MISRLSVGNGQPIWCALSQGASLLPLPAVFSCLEFFVKGCGPVGLFPAHPRVAGVSLAQIPDERSCW